MSDIPTDVIAAAMRALMVTEQGMVESVARAILAERERSHLVLGALRGLIERAHDEFHDVDGGDLRMWIALIDAALSKANPHSSELSSSQALTDMPGEVVPQPASPGANSTEQTS